MNWIELDNGTDLEELKAASNEGAVMVFKHSTRCSISSMVLSRLERAWSEQESGIKPYYLDLIRNRDKSNQIADVFQVQHQSPQVLVIKNGEVVYYDSHMGINYDSIIKVTKN